MKIKIIEDASKAKGLVVVIDVVRAFTSACFAINQGAEKIIPVVDLRIAYKLKKENPSFILMGERGGLKQPGFDFGNSPAQIQNENFSNKTVIFTTTHGTQAILTALKAKAKEIITGAFVNTDAVVNYIKKRKPQVVSLFSTDTSGKDNEDMMFAKYVRGCLQNKPLGFEKIRNNLKKHPHAYRFLVKPMTKFAQRDFHLCLELNRFNFVLKAQKDKDNLLCLLPFKA